MELAWSTAVSFPSYLLAGVVLGLLLAAKCLVQMAFHPGRALRCGEVIAGLAALAVAFILGIDAIGESGVPVALSTLAAWGLSLTFVAAHCGVSLGLVRGSQLASQPIAWLAIVLTLAITAWSSHRYTTGNLKIEMRNATFFNGDGTLESVPGLVAVTDHGRQVELYRWKPNSVDPADPLGSPSAEASPANCHGWVFASGEYFLECDSVEQILEDNGYQLCDSPEPGDLIVYRDAGGGITHTGLVKAASLGGTPVLESKWGLGKRLVHPPELQPYGERYSYYRSARQGHALAILSIRPPFTSIASY